MKDRYGREISYLRISVTDRCNLRCRYCMPAGGVRKRRHDEMLSNEEFAAAARAAAAEGVRKIRITGGEPLLRPGIVDICEAVKAAGVEQLCMTTNGLLLPKFEKGLLRAGVSRVNISLDTLKPRRYGEITRGGELADALKGIERALAAGFARVKINVVLMKDFNLDEIGDFVRFAAETGAEVRFIELMPLGEGAESYGERYVSSDIVLKQHPELIPLPGEGGVARRYAVPGGRGQIGLIQPMSCRFCAECSRMRLTADGMLRPCLHSSEELSIKGLTEEQMREAFRKAVLQKPRGMDEEAAAPAGGKKQFSGGTGGTEADKGRAGRGRNRNMNEIGG